MVEHTLLAVLAAGGPRVPGVGRAGVCNSEAKLESFLSTDEADLCSEVEEQTQRAVASNGFVCLTASSLPRSARLALLGTPICTRIRHLSCSLARAPRHKRHQLRTALRRVLLYIPTSSAK